MIIRNIEARKDNMGFEIIFRFDDNGLKRSCSIHIRNNASIKDVIRELVNLVYELERYTPVSAIGTAAASGASELKRASNLENKKEI